LILEALPYGHKATLALDVENIQLPYTPGRSFAKAQHPHLVQQFRRSPSATNVAHLEAAYSRGHPVRLDFAPDAPYLAASLLKRTRLVRRVKFEGERSGKIDSRMKAMAASSSSSGQAHLEAAYSRGHPVRLDFAPDAPYLAASLLKRHLARSW
jgi:hypothetical protein